MATDRPGSALRSGWPESIPTDLLAVVAFVLLVNISVFFPIINESVLRVAIILLFVLFVPGYVAIAALYPKRADASTDELHATGESLIPARLHAGISTIERIALSFSLSFILVPTICYPLIRWYSGVRLVPIVVTLTSMTLFLTAVAVVRRLQVPADDRFGTSVRTQVTSIQSRIRTPDSRMDAVLTIFLVASIIFAGGAAAFAANTLPQEDEFSSITVEETNDDAIIAVENNEYQSATYTLVVLEQSLESNDTDGSIDEQRERDHHEFQLDHGETERLAYELESTLSGSDVRLVWVLYVGDAPDDPSIESAPYHVYVTIDEE